MKVAIISEERWPDWQLSTDPEMWNLDEVPDDVVARWEKGLAAYEELQNEMGQWAEWYYPKECPTCGSEDRGVLHVMDESKATGEGRYCQDKWHEVVKPSEMNS